jgi:hypothetical protein
MDGKDTISLIKQHSPKRRPKYIEVKADRSAIAKGDVLAANG